MSKLQTLGQSKNYKSAGVLGEGPIEILIQLGNLHRSEGVLNRTSRSYDQIHANAKRFAKNAKGGSDDIMSPLYKRYPWPMRRQCNKDKSNF